MKLEHYLIKYGLLRGECGRELASSTLSSHALDQQTMRMTTTRGGAQGRCDS